MTTKAVIQNRLAQEGFRARNAMLGLTEVRNIYLPPALHPDLKAIAKRMLSKHEKTNKTQQEI